MKKFLIIFVVGIIITLAATGWHKSFRFIWSAYNNDLAKVEQMIVQEGYDPNTQIADYNAVRWILVVSTNPQIDTIDYLLKMGAAPEISKSNRISNVRLALKNNRLDIAALLVQFGANASDDEIALIHGAQN